MGERAQAIKKLYAEIKNSIYYLDNRKNAKDYDKGVFIHLEILRDRLKKLIDYLNEDELKRFEGVVKSIVVLLEK